MSVRKDTTVITLQAFDYTILANSLENCFLVLFRCYDLVEGKGFGVGGIDAVEEDKFLRGGVEGLFDAELEVLVGGGLELALAEGTDADGYLD